MVISSVLPSRCDICERKLDRIVDEAADLQLVFPESSLGQLLPILALRHFAIGPEAGRDILLGVVLDLG